MLKQPLKWLFYEWRCDLGSRVGVVTLWLCKNTKTHCLVGFSLVYSGNGGKKRLSDVKVMSKIAI